MWHVLGGRELLHLALAHRSPAPPNQPAVAGRCPVAQILVSWAILPRYTSETMMEAEADMLASAQRITAGYACHKPLCLRLALYLALCPGPRQPQPWGLLAHVLRHPAPAPSVG